MPEKKALERARRDRRQGKSASTQAGEFVREEIRHIRQGRHGARNPRQAIAIGLSEARRAGIRVPARAKSKSAESSASTSLGSRSISRRQNRPSARRSRAISGVLKREPRSSASRQSLSRQARASAAKRGVSQRHKAAVKAARTKGPRVRQAAARKAARTRARRKSA